MDIAPVMRALLRNKLGPTLVALQIACTLAIACNSMSIIQQRIQQMNRPSGIDEPSLFTLRNSWLNPNTDVKARTTEDLDLVRSIPGVIDAYATNNIPLLRAGIEYGAGSESGVGIAPGKQTTVTDRFYADEHALGTLGIRLVSGRWFAPSEVLNLGPYDQKSAPVVVITRGLANALFSQEDALGRRIYFHGSERPSRVIGVVDRAQNSRAASMANWSASEYATFMPYHFVNNGQFYVIRGDPRRLPQVMRAVQDSLLAATQDRAIENLMPFSETRRFAYAPMRASLVPLVEVGALLLTVTICGVVGLTSYSVSQRRRYIGMRRALGANRLDIVWYFHLENLLIAGVGCILGVVFGLAGNTWLALNAQVSRMETPFILFGALSLLVLCQAAALLPALRAAAISPASAIRGV